VESNNNKKRKEKERERGEIKKAEGDMRKNWKTEGGRKQRRRGRNREVKIKTGRQSEERKERIQKN
jgi:hypothetical protein